MRRLLSLLPFMGALGAAAPAPSQSDIVIHRPVSPQMDAAMKAAQASFPSFLARLQRLDPDLEDPMVKVGFDTAHGGREYLWVYVQGMRGRSITGRVANEPDDVPRVHEGQNIIVETGRIVDWAYLKHGKHYGHYTTRVLISAADAETRHQLGEPFLAPTPLEPEPN